MRRCRRRRARSQRVIGAGAPQRSVVRIDRIELRARDRVSGLSGCTNTTIASCATTIAGRRVAEALAERRLLVARSSAGSSRRCRPRLRAARSARWPNPASAAGSSTSGCCARNASLQRSTSVLSVSEPTIVKRAATSASARAAARVRCEQQAPQHERAPQRTPARHSHARAHDISASACGSSSRSAPNTHENVLPTPSSLVISSRA